MTEPKKFLLSEAAEVANNLPMPTLRSWVQRGHITFEHEDVPPGGNGLPHRISIESLVRVAITERLVVHRMLPPALAWKLARAFTHSSSGGSGWVGESAAAPLRMPCNLYEDGRTVLLGFADSERGEVIRVDGGTPLLDVLKHAGRDLVVLLDLTDIVGEAVVKAELLEQRRSFARARSMAATVDA